jgi:glycine cleavage system H protein
VEQSVVRFGCAGGPNNVERRAFQKVSGRLSSNFQGSFGAAAKSMRTRRICRKPFASIQPRVARDAAEGRSGVVVKINHSGDNSGWLVERRDHLEDHAIGVQELTLAHSQGRLVALSDQMGTVFYKRATFVTHLPESHLYTHSHNWLSKASEAPNLWRIGYTKFALRMLGELVDIQFDRKAQDAVQVGDILGTIEGFKAISDLFSVAKGRFVRGNPQLASKLEAIAESPYNEGWLYELEGVPDARAMDVNGYRDLLDATIDRMLQKEQER